MSAISKILNILIFVLFALMIGFMLVFIPIDIPTTDSAEEINQTELQELTYEKLNDERSKRDLHRLTQRNDIEEVSEYKTNKMISENYVSHKSPDGETVRDRFSSFNVDCRSVGENLAKTFYDTRVNTEYQGTVTYTSMDELSTGIVSQFMNSPEHKENLLDEQWESHGISVIITSDNNVYITHKFCK